MSELRKKWINKFDGAPPYKPESRPLEQYAAFCESEYEALTAENERLREALKPFAGFAEYAITHPRRGLHDDLYVWDNAVAIRMSDLQKARQALKGGAE